MARVRVTNVVVLNNPCKFFDPFQFQITFECMELSHGMLFFSDASQLAILLCFYPIYTRVNHL